MTDYRDLTVEEKKQHVEIAKKYDGDYEAPTKLSIQFAIEVLEEIVKSYKEDIEQETRNLTEWGLGYRGCSLDTLDRLNCKIQELKQYLDERV